MSMSVCGLRCARGGHLLSGGHRSTGAGLSRVVGQGGGPVGSGTFSRLLRSRRQFSRRRSHLRTGASSGTALKLLQEVSHAQNGTRRRRVDHWPT